MSEPYDGRVRGSAEEESTLSDDLRQVPLGHLIAVRREAVDAALRRVVERSADPARAQTAAFDSSV